jgi:alpha-D-xyloside xylohydrolase
MTTDHPRMLVSKPRSARALPRFLTPLLPPAGAETPPNRGPSVQNKPNYRCLWPENTDRARKQSQNKSNSSGPVLLGREMQNKPNFETPRIDLSIFPEMSYSDPIPCLGPKNKPNQTQFNRPHPIEPENAKLQVIDDYIIRVVVSPGDTSPTRNSLIIEEKERPPVEWTLQDSNRTVVLKTSKLNVLVQRATAEIGFFDLDGKPILLERPGGGKLITPAEVCGEQTYHVRQQWQSPQDECIYGLGHHQHGLLNQRGADIDLWQENWEIVVPVFTSNKGYGILWDNYSHSKFGFPVTANWIPPQNLFTKDDHAGGLSATYYNGIDFRDAKAHRIDRNINFDFKTFGPQVDNSFTTDPNWESNPLHPEIDPEKFSVRWEGQLLSEQAGDYTFKTFCTHNCRLWIDGKMVIDGWDTSQQYSSGSIRLQANKKYAIKCAWSRDAYDPMYKPHHGMIQVRWAPPAQESYDGMTLWSEVGDSIDYYFIYGPEMDRVVSGYRSLTGRAPLFGKYAYGYWHSHIGIQSQQEYLETIDEFRSRNIPLDILVQDLNYWVPNLWGSHCFDPRRYPDPTRMIAQAHEKNVHSMISVWGMFQKGSDNWKELHDAGLLFRYNNASFWTDKGTWYYNPFHPQGQETYWRQLNRALFSKGVDAWWLDASEPEISTPADPFLYKEVMKNNLGTGARYLNTFSLVQTRGVYEHQRQTAPDGRVLILARSSFAGQQKNATVVWTGDIDGTFDILRKQIVCGLNYSLSGLPYWTTDIGGFFVRKAHWPLLNKDPGYRELDTRWFQFATFCPIMRAHGCGPRREMWHMGAEAMKTQIKFAQLRYRLMPYLYSLAGAVTHKDDTIMRALVLDFPHDKKSHHITDQYMFGPAFLVNPVLEPGPKTRNVYLPQAAGWYDFWSGDYYEGAQEISADTPLDKMPLFVKAGSIVPMGPYLQYAAERLDPIELRVYTGANGSFTLYEDEGENYSYEKGIFATTDFSWDESKQTLTIAERKGAFPGVPKKRRLHVVWVQRDHGVGIEPEAQPDRMVEYVGRRVEVKR